MQDEALPESTARREAAEAARFAPAAQAIGEEIVAVSRKLWQRQYVDGSGGNVSSRVADRAVICTPTLMSKADVTLDDLGVVDLEGRQLAGHRQPTSEIALHLAIYNTVPQARSIVHCHPPHATAYAVTGHLPPIGVIPEFEVFVGPVALCPYETPGTEAFAQAVVPFAREHNTVLLSNHGVVCWADTPTHAEWTVEVVEAYFTTMLLASKLGAPIRTIAPDKLAELLALKQRLGLPDVRLREDVTAPVARSPRDAASAESGAPPSPRSVSLGRADVQAIVNAVTDAVIRALGGS
jgi:L-fuculose-phosphate aldolase